MAGWSGFSDADLRRISKPSEDEQKSPNLSKPKPKVKKVRNVQQRDRPSKPSTDENQTEQPLPDPSMRLSEGGKIAKTKYPTQSKDGKEENCVNDVEDNNSAQIEKKEEETLPLKEEEKVVEDVKELGEKEALNSELEKVQNFQQQQKMIEEANKHKRALLSKAIIDRQKKAKQEADKLRKVQQELNRLDSLLTADVSIIRDKIEVASLEYMEAQKRYERAEKEFVASKMDMFEKGETKESLTEHLYTVIHQNEVRKAKKLVELMEKLTMEVSPEEMELTIPVIPQLINLTAVATIHDPHAPKRLTSVSEEQTLNQQTDKNSQTVLTDEHNGKNNAICSDSSNQKTVEDDSKEELSKLTETPQNTSTPKSEETNNNQTCQEQQEQAQSATSIKQSNDHINEEKPQT